MFGRSSKPSGPSGEDNENSSSTSENYLKLAEDARRSGDESLAAHLYLAAFEAAQDDEGEADSVYIEGLRHAWHTACERKERSLAEYIYEKLEPFSSEDELKNRTEQLQDMTLEKLEEFGFSHDEVQGMAEMLSDEVMNAGPGSQIAAFMPPHLPVGSETSRKAETRETADTAEDSSEDSEEKAENQDREDSDKQKDAGAQAREQHSWRVTFDDLHGYQSAIAAMRERGIGLKDDPDFQEVLHELNERHGVDRMPYSHTVLLRCSSRDDANQFMVGVAGETGAPAVRMYMDRNPQGFPVLCVVTSPDFKWRGHNLRPAFEGPGVLLLQDLDTWGDPLESVPGDFAASYSQLTRGAREAVDFIRSCVEDPDVLVVATCDSSSELEPFFQQMIEPADAVEIEEPTREERADVWQHVCDLHPSIRAIDRETLIGCSAHLSRSEIYYVGLSAVEEAYREGVRERSYVPVSQQNIYEKLAAYQPVDSEEYVKLEDAVVAELRKSIDEWDEQLEGGQEDDGFATGGER